MADEKKRQLHPDVQALCQDLQVIDAQLRLSDDRLVHWNNKLAALSASEREKRALDLVVAAERLLKQGGTAVGHAIVQISVLIVALAGSEKAARDLMEKGGIDAPTTQKLLGQKEIAFTPRDQQAASPGSGILGLMIKKSTD